MEIKDTLYIGGEWVAPSTSNTIEVVSPATEEVIARVPEAAEADVDKAVAAAVAALHGPYPALTPDERADPIARLSQAIQARAGELQETITAEMGSPASWAMMGQVLAPSMVFDGWADLARTFPVNGSAAGQAGIGRKEQRTGRLGGEIKVDQNLGTGGLRMRTPRGSGEGESNPGMNGGFHVGGGVVRVKKSWPGGADGRGEAP